MSFEITKFQTFYPRTYAVLESGVLAILGYRYAPQNKIDKAIALLAAVAIGAVMNRDQ